MMIGIPPERVISMSAKLAAWGFDLISGSDLAIIAISATVSKGKLLSFVRYADAIARPVIAPSKRLGDSARNHRRTQRRIAPKQIGERTSLLRTYNTSCGMNARSN